MDLDGIAIFVKVLQAGSFSRAAKLLGMPNSTVSAKVSALEKRLGVTLLQRTTRKLRATQAGEAYYQRSLRALEELQAAENELETGRAEPQGILRLTAPVEIGHSLLPALVHAYSDRPHQSGLRRLRARLALLRLRRLRCDGPACPDRTSRRLAHSLHAHCLAVSCEALSSRQL